MKTQSICYSNPRDSYGLSFVTNLIPVLSLCFVICVSGFSNRQAGAQEIQWFPDIKSATKAAGEQNKLILLHFTAKWCKPCRSLETFVFTSPDVQRAFDNNVIAVKVDVDANSHLVQEYGVASVPFDVAVTPVGRVVSKRKSPRDSIAYEKMINDFHTIIAELAEGESPTLNQGLTQLKQALENHKPKFEGQSTSFTPAAPTYQAPQPSSDSAELKRKSRFVANPYVQQEKPVEPQHVANAFSPIQELTSPSTNPKPSSDFASGGDFAPAGEFGTTGNFAPSGNFKPAPTHPAPFAPQPPQQSNSFVPSTGQPGHGKIAANGTANQTLQPQMQKNPFMMQPRAGAPVQQVQVNPYTTQAQPVPPSDSAFQSPTDQLQNHQVSQPGHPNLDTHHAQPRVVMNDKFFGKPSAMQIQKEHANGNYQAKISLPQDNDFLPPAALLPESKEAVDDAAEASTIRDVAPDNPLQQPGSMAAPAPSSKVALKTLESAPDASAKTLDFALKTTDSASDASAKALDVAVNTTDSASDAGAKALEMASAKQATSPVYALHGKCPVTLLTKSKWVDGDPRWGCVHRDRIYIFATEQNLKIFQNNPDAHSPILAGFDPVVYQETGRLVNGLEKHGVFMGKTPHQRIVLFANAETRARFQSQPKTYLTAVRQAMHKTVTSSKTMR